MSFKAIALDIDGTVFSSEEIILETYVDSIREFAEATGKEIDIPGHPEIMREIGKPVKVIFQNLLPNLPEADQNRISDRVLELLVQKIQIGKGHYYPGSETTLETLHQKGIILTACSNGRTPYVSAILEKMGVLPLFRPILVIDQISRFAKGDILRDIIRDLDAQPREVLMVGDRFSDYEAARKNGSPFAFCEYGHAEPGEIPDYEFLLKEPEDLLKILKLA
jgi:phosphoglycolate phosphatase